MIGHNFKSNVVANFTKHFALDVIDDGKDKPQFSVVCKGGRKNFYPEQISAMILAELKNLSENYLGQPVSNAIITVPAYFNETQRESTKIAGSMAGLNVKKILNEPAAAALAFGHIEHPQKEKQNVLIYDLGKSSFSHNICISKTDFFFSVFVFILCMFAFIEINFFRWWYIRRGCCQH